MVGRKARYGWDDVSAFAEETDMNLPMSKKEFETLPFRDDLKFSPVSGAYFRAKAHPGYVFQAQTWGQYDWNLWAWWCFKVDFD